MNIDFIQFPVSDDKLPCAIRIRAPTDVNRTSSHLVLLLDVSESMSDANKLEHVKKCCQLIVDLLTPEDHLSIITFGERSEILLNNVAVDTAHKEHIRAIITNLNVDGCTNLSAGLYNVRQVLESSKQKAGLLLLTDGIANLGIKDPVGLETIVGGLCTDFPYLSVHCVGYGTDHNAELLRIIAEKNQGSYNIVSSIEDTAMAFGDTLGGLMSCAAQNVVVQLPADAVVHGPYKNVLKGIHLGDVYAGTNPILLFDLPSTASTASTATTATTVTADTVSVSGILMSTGQLFRENASWVHKEEQDTEIRLCFLRYECSNILQDLRVWNTLTPASKLALSGRIDTFADRLATPALASEPVTASLLLEIPLLRSILAKAQQNHITRDDTSILSQHSAVLGLGRGFSSPMRPTGPHHPIYRVGAQYNMDTPYAFTAAGAATATAAPLENDEPTNSVFQNRTQTRVSTLLRTLSQQ